MAVKRFYDSIERLWKESAAENLGSGKRFLVIGDLRIGDGGENDLFRHNARLVRETLTAYYRDGWTLVLNGDSEDLTGHWLKDIQNTWRSFFSVIDAFNEAGRLKKLIGDADLGLIRKSSYPYRQSHGLRIQWQGRSIFIIHGHQAARGIAKMDYLADYIPFFLDRSKNLPNAELGSHPEKRRKAVQRLYRAALREGWIILFSHTRRPLFSSSPMHHLVRSEIEEVVERCIRDQHQLIKPRKRGTRGGRATLTMFDEALSSSPGALGSPETDNGSMGTTTHVHQIAPCLFNPGEASGSTGMSAIEIENSGIRFVHWADTRDRGERFRTAQESRPTETENSSTCSITDAGRYHRYQLAEASWGPLFAAIDQARQKGRRDDTMILPCASS